MSWAEGARSREVTGRERSGGCARRRRRYRIGRGQGGKEHEKVSCRCVDRGGGSGNGPGWAAAEKLIVDGSTGVMPLVGALAKAYHARNPEAVVELGKGLGTKARIEALAEGKIDIALASHGLNAEEVSRQGMTVHEIAKVAVVFGVNKTVPVGRSRRAADL